MDMQGIMGLLTGQYARDYDAVMAKNAQWEKEQAAERAYQSRAGKLKNIFGGPVGQPLATGGQDAGGNTVDGAFSQINPATLEPLPATGFHSENPLEKQLAMMQAMDLNPDAFKDMGTKLALQPGEYKEAIDVQNAKDTGAKATKLAELNFYKNNPKAQEIKVKNVDGSESVTRRSEYFDENEQPISGATELTDARQEQKIEEKEAGGGSRIPQTQMFDPVLNRTVWVQEGDNSPETHSYLPLNHMQTPQEKIANAEKRSKKLQSLLTMRDKFQNAITVANNAQGQIGFMSTGMPAQFTSWIKSSPGGTMESMLTTLKSAEGIGELMRMKQESDNGSSGFGSLQKTELDLLVAKTAMLDAGMDDDVLKENLTTIHSLYKSLNESIEADIKSMQEANTQTSKTPTSPNSSFAAFKAQQGK